MISRLSGELAEKSPGDVIVDVRGVGYQLAISLQTFYRLPEEGEPVLLHVVTNLREHALELFGFAAPQERALFLALRTVSGIGPRLALAVLSGIDARELAVVVRSGDVARLVSVPGVGRKTAERILVELKDKIEAPATVPAESQPIADDAVAALLALGYKQAEALRAVRAVGDKANDLEDLIKRALARLG